MGWSSRGFNNYGIYKDVSREMEIVIGYNISEKVLSTKKGKRYTVLSSDTKVRIVVRLSLVRLFFYGLILNLRLRGSNKNGKRIFRRLLSTN